jgi:hypothetical protein
MMALQRLLAREALREPRSPSIFEIEMAVLRLLTGVGLVPADKADEEVDQD